MENTTENNTLKEKLIEEPCPQNTPDKIPSISQQSTADEENRYKSIYFFSKRIKKSQKKFIIVISLNILYIIMQVVGGLISNSYAIVGDAAHECTDLTGYVISLISLCVSLRPANKKYTFGFYRFEVLGSVAAVLVMWVFIFILVTEAIERFNNLDDFEIQGYLMFTFACLGMLFNAIFACIFGHHDHGHGGGHSHSHGHEGEHNHGSESHKHSSAEHAEHATSDEKEEQLEAGYDNVPKPKSKVKSSIDLNSAAGLLSASMDVLQSFGIVVASIVVWQVPEAKWLDPCCSLFFAVTVLIASFRNIWRAIMVLMERVPRGIDVEEIKADLIKIEGVESVHDLHVWSLTDGVPCCTVHLSVDPNSSVCRIIDQANKYLSQLGINHCTVQCEHMQHTLYCAHECKST